MTFRVGQKVVCVDDSPDFIGRPVVVQNGHVYTVFSCFDWHGNQGITLVEVDPGAAPGWHVCRFRPAVNRKTDISIFTKMLTPQGAEA